MKAETPRSSRRKYKEFVGKYHSRTLDEDAGGAQVSKANKDEQHTADAAPAPEEKPKGKRREYLRDTCGGSGPTSSRSSSSFCCR